MVEQTLEYENAHFLLSLLAGDVGLAQAIGKEFDVKVTTRDAWIKFFGDKTFILSQNSKLIADGAILLSSNNGFC